MRMSLELRAVAFGALLVLASPARVFCQEAVSGPPPRVTDAQPKYERPKTPSINGALERSLTDLSDAQSQLRALVAEGKMRRFLGMQGLWMADNKSVVGPTNTICSASFQSESGPLVGFDRMVFLGDNRGPELRELRYKILYYHDGRVKLFMRLGPGSLDFYPDGTLKEFSAELDDHTSCEASWDADGKLVSEGTSTHLPHTEKSLPEFENMLRHGDYNKKAEAVSAMIEIGRAAIPYALNVLSDGDEQSREQAAGAFQFLHDQSGSFVPALAARLRKDDSADVRRMIALALGSQGSLGAPAIPALEETATNDVPAVAGVAKFSLDRIQRSLSK